MAQSRSQRMTLVLQLAARTEEGAATALKNSRHSLDQAQAQLQQIRQYHQEYVTELNTKTTNLTAQTMINDRLFLQRLSDVETTQLQQIQQLQVAENSCLKNWTLCYQRRKSIEALITRLQKEESDLLDKQLQKELDELSSQMHFYHSD